MHFLGFSFQNFKLLFILILVFLTHTFNSQKNKNSIKKSKNKTTNLTGGGQQSLLLLTFSGAILGPLLFISILLFPNFFFLSSFSATFYLLVSSLALASTSFLAF